jgi:hypothetical protein
MLDGSKSASEVRTARMLQLEQEFLRRFPAEAAPDPMHTRPGSREYSGQRVSGRDVNLPD